MIPVFLVSFNQRRRPPRRVQVARWGGRKRTRENPLAKIKAASNPLTVTTTRTGFQTEVRPAKVDALLVRAAGLARVPSTAPAFATSLVGGQYPPTRTKTVQQNLQIFLPNVCSLPAALELQTWLSSHGTSKPTSHLQRTTSRATHSSVFATCPDFATRVLPITSVREPTSVPDVQKIKVQIGDSCFSAS